MQLGMIERDAIAGKSGSVFEHASHPAIFMSAHGSLRG